MFKEIFKPSLILILVCAVVTGALAYVNGVTKPIIAQRENQAKQEGLLKVMPSAESFSEQKSCDQLKKEGLSPSKRVIGIFEGKAAAENIGYVVELASKGYGGDIKMLVGIDKDLSVTGVYLTGHNETPGLGSKASDDVFVNQYIGTSPKGGFSVVKGAAKSDAEIQAISGATISSRAVTVGVNDALELVRSIVGGE